jgi:hypothetical protein
VGHTDFLPSSFYLFIYHILCKNFRFSLRLQPKFFSQDLKSGTKVMLQNIFSVNVIALTVKSTSTIHTSFAIMRLFFHKVSVIFNTLLPTSINKLCNTVVKLVSRLQSTSRTVQGNFKQTAATQPYSSS